MMEAAVHQFRPPALRQESVKKDTAEITEKLIKNSQDELTGLTNFVDQAKETASQTFQERNHAATEFTGWYQRHICKLKELHDGIEADDRSLTSKQMEIDKLKQKVDGCDKQLSGFQTQINQVENFLVECRLYLPGARDQKEYDEKQVALLDTEIENIGNYLKNGIDMYGRPIDRDLAMQMYEQLRMQKTEAMRVQEKSASDFSKTSIDQSSAQIDLERLNKKVQEISAKHNMTQQEIIELSVELHRLRQSRVEKQTLFDAIAQRLNEIGDLTDLPDDELKTETDPADKPDLPALVADTGRLALVGSERSA